ncbi:MAG: SAM-dependent methyltransferase [Nocardioides sp.]|nr:SAM-dependent methyltransferase [Nocardioides sp.]
MTTLWERVARASNGDDYAHAYAARFRALAESGADVHGEATFVAGLVPAPARVLDAGCGTGRIGAHLAGLGYDVVGCDVDASMVAVAREEWPELDWRVADLATLDGVDLGPAYDVVLLAGNVFPLLEPGTLAAAARGLAAHVADDGVVVAGFGLDTGHLPAGAPVVSLDEVDVALAAAGLVAADRWSSWDGAPHDPSTGYVVGTWRRR